MSLLFTGPNLITCRGCGCDDDHACVQADGTPCGWALLDIETPTGVCTACAISVRWHPRALGTMGLIDLDEKAVA